MTKRRHILWLLPLLVAGLFNMPAQAQTNSGPIAQFLEVSPARDDFSVPAGTTQVRQVTIRNRHVAPIRVKPSFDNLIVTNDSGGVKPATEPTPYDLARYVKISTEELTLPAGQSQTISVTVSMPANVAPGGYYGMMRFSPINRTDLPPVAIQGDIASLFLVRVPGPTDEKGTIKDFQMLSADGQKQGSIAIGNDFYFRSIIRNDGRVHFSAAPKFTANGQFGSFERVVDTENVFPGGDRRFETRWERAKTGYYTVTVQTALPGDPAASKTFHVLIIEPLVAVIGTVVLVLLIILIVFLILRRRRRRRDQALF